SVSETGFTPQILTMAFGSTVRWTNTGGTQQTITERTPLALFDSGPLGPGATFDYFFNAASTYTVGSIQNPSRKQLIKIPMTSVPDSGTTATSFLLKWAQLPPPPDLIF